MRIHRVRSTNPIFDLPRPLDAGGHVPVQEHFEAEPGKFSLKQFRQAVARLGACSAK